MFQEWYVNAWIWQQPYTGSIMPIDDIFSVQVTFRMIVFTILLDENRLFAKHWHTDSQTHGPMLIAMKKKACCLNSNRFILCGLWGHAVNSMLTNAVLFVIRYHHHTFCHSVSSPYFLSFGNITIPFVIRYYHHTFCHSVSSPYFLSFGIITILSVIRYHHHTFCHSVSSPYFLSFGIITILFVIR